MDGKKAVAPPKSAKTIPELIDHLRASTGLSDRAIAAYAGLSNNSINLWRRGKLIPSSDSCHRLAAWAGLPPEYVLRLAGHLAPADAAPAEDPVIPEVRAILATYSPAEQRRLVLPLLQASQQIREASRDDARAPERPTSPARPQQRRKAPRQ